MMIDFFMFHYQSELEFIDLTYFFWYRFFFCYCCLFCGCCAVGIFREVPKLYQLQPNGELYKKSSSRFHGLKLNGYFFSLFVWEQERVEVDEMREMVCSSSEREYWFIFSSVIMLLAILYSMDYKNEIDKVLPEMRCLFFHAKCCLKVL